MEIKDLMIGDWVQTTYPTGKVEYRKVEGVMQNHIVCNNGVTNAIEPIPLTAEILEKNGFVNSGGLWHLSGEDMGLMQGCKSFQAFAYYADPRYCFCEIAYLHELQHALKLCGIEKEIVL